MFLEVATVTEALLLRIWIHSDVNQPVGHKQKQGKIT